MLGHLQNSQVRSFFMKNISSLFALMLILGMTAPVSAQSFPQKRAITLVVPFAPGGGTDAIARDLAKPLADKLGVPVVVDNKGGAGGAIAAQQISQAKPDGHTLLFVTSTFVTAAATDRKLPYDVNKDFSPISKVGSGPLLLVVNPQTGITQVAGLIDNAKRNPNSLNYVSAGQGSINHLSGELFAQRTGTQMTHIPYKGSGPATMDLIGGQAQIFFATVPTILSQVKAGKVKLIATTSKSRSKLFPDVPTVMESGVKSFEVGTWWGIVGPKDLPADIVAILNRAINESTATEALVKRFEEEGAERFAGTPAEFGTSIKHELDGWRKVVLDAGLKID
ncbi:MAG: tripartite tricarboxylate transporter substrate binding protein [Betaproteobacteria bacterium]|nr:tripartite tricarboxylate transporter substrate binding protein [Betaproteobacteria bacterium]